MLNADLPKSLRQAILLPLVDELLPIVGNDKDAAWQGAEAGTMCFNPRTANEFRLAVRVALFNILANRLTAEANAPTLTPACAIRMYNCALSYVRAADKAERQLEKLQAGGPQKEKPQPKAGTAQAAPAPKTTAKAPTANIPAYKLLKQDRRLAKQQERDARLKAQAPNIPLTALTPALHDTHARPPLA